MTLVTGAYWALKLVTSPRDWCGAAGVLHTDQHMHLLLKFLDLPLCDVEEV